MRSILDDVLLHGQNSATLEAAHDLLRTLTADKKYARAMDSGSSLAEILEEKGFGGLWRACSMGSMDDIPRDCVELTAKLIEVSFAL
jgi:neurofibromin 1